MEARPDGIKMNFYEPEEAQRRVPSRASGRVDPPINSRKMYRESGQRQTGRRGRPLGLPLQAFLSSRRSQLPRSGFQAL